MKNLTLGSLLVALVFGSACFTRPAQDDDDNATGLGPGEQSHGGTCQGAVWECYYLDDIPSCTYQQGCSWDFSVDDCNGPQTSCDNIADKGVCIRQIGCEWVDDSGTVESSLLDGDCVGTPTPCVSYTEQASCNRQAGCTWGYSAGCDIDFSEVSYGYDCGTWSVHDIDVDGHPEVTIAQCEGRDGCSWQGDHYSDEP